MFHRWCKLAVSVPARCAASRHQYLRSSALADTCEALTMNLFIAWQWLYPAVVTDQHYNAGKQKAVMSVGLNRSASAEAQA